MRNQFLLHDAENRFATAKICGRTRRAKSSSKILRNPAAQFHVAQQFLNPSVHINSQALSLARETSRPCTP